MEAVFLLSVAVERQAWDRLLCQSHGQARICGWYPYELGRSSHLEATGEFFGRANWQSPFFGSPITNHHASSLPSQNSQLI